MHLNLKVSGPKICDAARETCQENFSCVKPDSELVSTRALRDQTSPIIGIQVESGCPFASERATVTSLKRSPAFKLWVFCRTDYHLATPELARSARRADIYKEARFSDHAPLTIGYEFGF